MRSVSPGEASKPPRGLRNQSYACRRRAPTKPASSPTIRRRDKKGGKQVKVVQVLTRLLVVGHQVVGDELARSVRVEVVLHAVGGLLHHLAHFVEAGGRDHVAGAVHLPGDGRVPRADLVVARGAGG